MSICDWPSPRFSVLHAYSMCVCVCLCVCLYLCLCVCGLCVVCILFHLCSLCRIYSNPPTTVAGRYVNSKVPNSALPKVKMHLYSDPWIPWCVHCVCMYLCVCVFVCSVCCSIGRSLSHTISLSPCNKQLCMYGCGVHAFVYAISQQSTCSHSHCVCVRFSCSNYPFIHHHHHPLLSLSTLPSSSPTVQGNTQSIQ
jgi:hypothetical protein